jgi:hypothetical protein
MEHQEELPEEPPEEQAVEIPGTMEVDFKHTPALLIKNA